VGAWPDLRPAGDFGLEGRLGSGDYPWSVRLKALLSEWMPWIRRRFRLTPEIERQLLRISARSIDYRLGGEKWKWRRRLYGRTKPGTLVEASHPAENGSLGGAGAGLHRDRPGVAFSQRTSGDFCYSLNLTDIHTGWTET